MLKPSIIQISKDHHSLCYLQSSLSVYPIRLRPGQEIKKELQDFVIKEKLRAAFVLTCCGSITKVTLRFAEKENNEDKKVQTG